MLISAAAVRASWVSPSRLDQVIGVADLLEPLGSVEQPAGGEKDTPLDDVPPEA
ncbi:hypothetical protein WME75_25425 [Sorangium sp. So ce1014]|uniref:hypothetical protein n=1 Tax=Sorangium sp. So ce1014 TaxID=3133326 RepID=UPI003F6332F0